MSEIESSLRLQFLGASSEIEAAENLHNWDLEKQHSQLSETETDLMTILRQEEEGLDSYPRPVVDQLINALQARKHYPGKPPVQTAFEHYSTRMFLWDYELIVEVLAKLGNRKIIDWAAHSLFMLTDNMRDNGFISNMQYLDHNEGLHIGGRLERLTFKNKDGSDYTQPFLLPTATNAVFEGYIRVGDHEAAWSFLRSMYPVNKLHGSYYEKVMASPDNPLAANEHPHGDGRDNHGKFKLPRFGDKTPLLWDYADVVQDIALTYFKNVRLKLVDWDPEKARKIYGRRDVMFNTLIVKNTLVLRDLATLLAEQEADLDKKAEYIDDASHFEEYASELEQAIHDHMWNERDIWSPKGNRTHRGLFRSIKGNGKLEKYIDSGDLMSLGLKRLRARQLIAGINLTLTSHNTNYGISGSPHDSPIADFHYQRRTGCNWDVIWPHMQKIHGDDLRMQANRIVTEPEFRAEFDSELEADQALFLCNIIADIAAARTKELTKDTYAEQYNPITGEPQRYPHVKRFGMAMQAEIFNYIGLAENDSYFNLCRKIGRVVNICSVSPYEWDEIETPSSLS